MSAVSRLVTKCVTNHAEYANQNSMRMKCLEKLSSAMYGSADKVFVRDFFVIILREHDDQLEPYIEKYPSKLVVDIEVVSYADLSNISSCIVYEVNGDKEFRKIVSFETTDHVDFFNNLFGYLIVGPPGSSTPTRLDERGLNKIVEELEKKIGTDKIVSYSSGNVFYQLIVENKLHKYGESTAPEHLTNWLKTNTKLCLAFYHFFIAVFPDLFKSSQDDTRPYVFTQDFEQTSLFVHYKEENDTLFAENNAIKLQESCATIAGELCYFIYHEAMDKTTDISIKERLAKALDAFSRKIAEIDTKENSPTSMKAFL